MRQLTNALMEAREGTGEVRATLLRAAFKPRLPGEGERWCAGGAGATAHGPLCHGSATTDKQQLPQHPTGVPCRWQLRQLPIPAPPAHPPATCNCLPPPTCTAPCTAPPAAGLTKMVSKLSKEGAWRKALEVFEAVEEMG
jgi:hypothetical protein